MKKLLFASTLLLMAMGAITACSSNEDDPEDDNVINMLPQTRSINLTDEQKTFVKKNRDFSFNLFRTVNQYAKKGNSILLSPISVTYMLGMLNDGADGQTAKEIASMLGLEENDKNALNEFCKKLLESAPNVDENVKLKIANYIAANKHLDIELASTYKSEMSSFYQAETSDLDFTSANAVKTINNWCSKQTDGMIDKIIDSLDPESYVVLMNAVNFEATWTNKFDKKKTASETFTTENGNSKKQPLMHQEMMANCGKNDIFSILRLPFGSGDKWDMYVLLPNEGKNVDDIINALNNENWIETINIPNIPPKIVDAKIPRFTTECKTDLVPILKQMGTPSMFSPEAEFPGICSNNKYLKIGEMFQKAAAKVNEEGAKMVAVTYTNMISATGTLPEREHTDFHANRPFVYIIQESSSGVIFFMGTYKGE